MSLGHILYLYETATGLGHQRRASGVVNGLIERGFHVTVASGTFVEPEQYFDARSELVPLPANRSKQLDGQFYYYDEQNVLQLDENFDMGNWKRSRVEAMRAIAEGPQIHAVIGEWWPFQRRNEFDGIVDLVIDRQTERFGRPLIISSARDILTKFEGRDDAKAEAAQKAAIRAINGKVDHILIHGDPLLVSLQETFHRHAELQKPVTYTGYVVNDGAKDADSVSQREKTVIVSCGSGDKGHHLLKAAFEARPLTSLRHHEWVYVLGPRIAPEERQEFLELVESFNPVADGLPLKQTIRDQLPDLPHHLCHADFAISYAGYNTTMETLMSRVPGVLVPKFKFLASGEMMFDQEQWGRLIRLQSNNMMTPAHPIEAMEPATFARIIDEAYAKGSPHMPLNMNGAGNTADIMAEMVLTRQGIGMLPNMTTATPASAIIDENMPEIFVAANDPRMPGANLA